MALGAVGACYIRQNHDFQVELEISFNWKWVEELMCILVKIAGIEDDGIRKNWVSAPE